MLTYPQIDPVAFSLGPLAVHWYGIMYIVAFGACWYLGHIRARNAMALGVAGEDLKKAGKKAKKRQAKTNDATSGKNSQASAERVPAHPGTSGAAVWTSEQLSDLVFYGALGAVFGGRVGSVLFYNFDRFIGDPLWLLRVWEGGMSFHGGFLGVMLAFYLYARKINRRYFDVLDFIAPFAPLGLGIGRIGNFIGGELWGRPTDVAWGMVFPHVDQLPRHASQLYQAFLEGVVLFALMWWFSSRARPRYAVSALFAIGYGVQRFFVEFYREPDDWLGFVALDWLTMGQVLSIPMIAAGVAMMVLAYKKREA